MNYVRYRVLTILKNEMPKKNYLHGFSRMFAFKSAYSLDKLYPQSNQNIYTPTFVPEDPNAKFTGYIPMKELDITYTNSSGPGGQNVNKVQTKVDVRFNVKNASWISDEIKEKLLEKHENKINKDGYLIIKSDLTRSQQLNLADALQKLRQMIRDLIVVPAEPDAVTEEKHRKLQLKASYERVFVKRMKSQIKNARRDCSTD